MPKRWVTVREHARLTIGEQQSHTGHNLEQAAIPESAFNWLCQLQAKARRPPGGGGESALATAG